MGFIDKLKEINTLRDELDKESDRGCVLLSVSFLEIELKELLERYLVNNSKIQEKVFGGSNGPLSTLSSKIDICYLLGLISKLTYDDLNLIRKVRNEFAHSKLAIDFNDHKIKNICINLNSHYREKNDPVRKIFISSVYGLLSKIVFSNILQISEKVENIEKEVEFRESFKIKVKSLQNEAANYYDHLNFLYKDSPNKEKLVEEDWQEYKNQIFNIYEQVHKLLNKKQII